MNYQKIGANGWPLGAPELAAFRDPKTGLMWAAQDVSTKSMNWSDAKSACAKFHCAGFGDWRLPTIAELETLRDLSRFDPAADPELGLKSNWYWSSTSLAQSEDFCAWNVDFISGGVYSLSKDYTAFVRAVRGGNTP